MSCDAHAVVVADHPGDALDHVGRRLAELEGRWSRFRDDSEVTSLNRACGAAHRCSGDTIRLVEELVRAWHATDGDFDPTLVGMLVELGYEASRVDATARTSLSADVAPRGRPDRIMVDRSAGTVRLPAGTALDAGGLGKGLAGDLIVDELLSLGTRGALLSIGGDVRVAGDPPVGDHWLIEVTPTPADAPVRIGLRNGGVATSSSRLRTWASADVANHHLLDPETGRSTSGDVVACTVIAGTAAWAETFTKVAFVRGCADALARFADIGLGARITTDDGRHHHSPAWWDFAR